MLADAVVVVDHVARVAHAWPRELVHERERSERFLVEEVVDDDDADDDDEDDEGNPISPSKRDAKAAKGRERAEDWFEQALNNRGVASIQDVVRLGYADELVGAMAAPAAEEPSS